MQRYCLQSKEKNNELRELLKYAVKYIREATDFEYSAIVALNPYEKAHKFRVSAKKWAKMPLSLRFLNKNSNNLLRWKEERDDIKVLKLIKEYYEKKKKLPNLGRRGVHIIDFDNIILEDIEKIEDKDVKELILSTQLVKTASDSIHAIFIVKEDNKVIDVPTEHFRNRNKKTGIDFLNRDVYVVAPPSKIKKSYSFINDKEPLEISKETWFALRDYLIDYFKLEYTKDSGVEIDEKEIKDYIELENGIKIPRISYEDTIFLLNFVLGLNIKAEGDSVAISCLLHPEKHNNKDQNKSAVVYRAKNGAGLIHCHVCKYTADIYYILNKLCNMSYFDVLKLCKFCFSDKYKAIIPEEEKEDKNDLREIELEKIEKAFNRKNSKLRNVYRLLIENADSENLVCISTTEIAKKLQLNSHVVVIKYLKHLQRLQLIEKVIAGRQHIANTYRVRKLATFLKGEKVTADDNILISNTPQPLSYKTSNNKKEKVTTEKVNTTIRKDVEYCIFEFTKDVPAILGVDLKPYGNLQRGFKKGEKVVIPLQNAFALSIRGAGRIILNNALLDTFLSLLSQCKLFEKKINKEAWVQLRDTEFSHIKHTLTKVSSPQEVEKLLEHLEPFHQAQWVYISKSKLYMFLLKQKRFYRE